ncbi:MAG: divalent-cation tolerance protein CutA [Acidobacteriota bacterium]
MPSTPEALRVLTTTDREDHAGRIAEELVGRRLAACVNIIPRIRSVYRWKGEVARDEEFLLLCKTRPDRFEDLRAAVRGIHTYDCPEVIAVPVTAGDPDYLGWLTGEVDPTGGR